MCVPNLSNSKLPRYFTQIHEHEPSCGTRGEVRGSPKTLGIINVFTKYGNNFGDMSEPKVVYQPSNRQTNITFHRAM